MGAILLGLGTAVPERSIGQGDAVTQAVTRCCTTTDHARLLPVLYRRTRVARRSSVLLEEPDGSGNPHPFFPPALTADDRGPTTAGRMVRYHELVGPLAESAARSALHDAGVASQRITHLVTVSCTGFVAPGFDVHLIKSLGLASTVERTHIGFMGCHGALNGLRVAAMIARADPDAVVLLTAAELCSLHFRYGWDPDKVVANALFADGAGAVVLSSNSMGETPGNGWEVKAHGACLFPDSQDAMTWTLGDHGFEMTLSPRVPGLIEAHLRPWMESWLKKYGLRIGDVGSWAIHPGGPRIIGSALRALGLDENAAAVSQAVLAEHGNMSSATILFILRETKRIGVRRPCVALGFGPGLAAEAALIL
ncbi:MAG: type III polyketide synthase [Planctomycetes bacterium]|nr:type III polyketide synthase [Planctomycetota bacterium]